MTNSYNALNAQARILAEAFCDATEARDSIKPLEELEKAAREGLVEMLNKPAILRGDFNLDRYKGADSEFKFPAEGCQLVITPRYSFEANQDESKTLMADREKLERAKQQVKKLENDVKHGEEKMILEGRATRITKTITVSVKRIAKPEFTMEID